MTTQSTQQTDGEELVWVHLFGSQPAGVSLEGGATINPGETKQVPRSIAHKIVHTHRGELVDGPPQ